MSGTSHLPLLLRARARMAWNHLGLVFRESRLRVLATLVFIFAIWAGLYGMFLLVFRWLGRTPLEGAVATPMVFNLFFLMMLALLTFSNAIIAYGALFSPRESAYLIAGPVRPRDVVCLKYLETLVFSSWSLVLLGLPLMRAMADATAEPSFFYPLFVTYFLVFIPIPGALGLAAAWFTARFVSRNLRRAALLGGAALLAALGVMALRLVRQAPSDSELWLRSFVARMQFVESALWPNAWVSRGIDRATEGRVDEALMYLAVTAANALFLSWLAVGIVSRYFIPAFDRASGARGGAARRPSSAAGGIAGRMFFYLPVPLRLVAAKDLRTFFRDPMQWSQLVILFTLMGLYLLNIPNLHGDLTGTRFQLIIPFLNLCAVSLILATFTSRFVFPLVSLEGHQLWLIGLLPVPRGRVLLAKFAFAMTVTLSVGGAAMLLASAILELDWVWTTVHLAVTFAVCFGLCGLAVGVGARWPMFGQTNAARIANGVGGTINLVASVVLVAVLMMGLGYAAWQSLHLSVVDRTADLYMLSAAGLAVAVSIVTGWTALRMGARHFQSIEV